MPLFQVLMVLIVVGVLLWLVNNFIPMAGSIKSILNAVVVIACGFVAPEHFWSHSFSFPDPRRGVTRQALRLAGWSGQGLLS
jgi:uncharacterized membrane protein YkgB